MTDVIIRSSDPETVIPLLQFALQKEIDVIERGYERTKRNLDAFEAKYRMSSSEFYRKFTRRELPDEVDYIEWAGKWETLVRSQKQLDALKGVVICT